MKKYVIAIPLIIGLYIYSVFNFDYDISLPNNWVAIPADVLEYYVAEVSKMTGRQEKYDHAYQLSNSKDWFKLPYILVQINRDKKIPYSDIKLFELYDPNNQNYAHSSILDKTDEAHYALLSDSLYESDLNIVWYTGYFNMEGVGQVKQLIATKLTASGYIQFNCISYEKKFDKYEAVFREIVRSVQLNDNDVYQLE